MDKSAVVRIVEEGIPSPPGPRCGTASGPRPGCSEPAFRSSMDVAMVEIEVGVTTPQPISAMPSAIKPTPARARYAIQERLPGVIDDQGSDQAN